MSTGSEKATPTVPELLRDFEVLIDDRLSQERRRRRGAERMGRIALGLAALALLLAGVMAYSLYGRGRPGVNAGIVSARELHLLDGAGRVRGSWGVLRDGTTRLSMLDERGTERMRLTLLNSGAQGITLADAQGEGRVVLSLEGTEGSRLTFADRAGRPRTLLGLSSQDAGTLIFADAEGTPRAAMGLETDGRATFVLPADRGAPPPEPADTTSETED